MTQTLAIIDYGMGNLHSAAKAFMHVSSHTKVLVTNDHDKILAADKVVLPGVGAIRDCIGEIKRLAFDELLVDCIRAGKPLLGICVGMQALLTESEENNGVECLNILPGKVVKFQQQTGQSEKIKIPHMGWNQVKIHQQHPIFNGIPDHQYFYFVHSYHAKLEDNALMLASSDYPEEFPAIIGRDNIVATQFHPEKSQHFGLALLANFLKWDGN